MLSLGVDTGGSVRQPAHLNAVIGLKPTYGRCSRWGLIEYSTSMDQVGIFARSTTDCSLLCTMLFGADGKD